MKKDNPTQDQLQQIVTESDPLLRQLWENRRADSDIIVLADMRIDEYRRHAESWWGADFVSRFVCESEQKPGYPFLPYLQPSSLVDALLATKPRSAQHEAGKELRGFARLGLVPLWVVDQEGHWATCRSNSEKVVIARYNPLDGSPEHN
jgi:hypothetical protein